MNPFESGVHSGFAGGWVRDGQVDFFVNFFLLPNISLDYFLPRLSRKNPNLVLNLPKFVPKKWTFSKIEGKLHFDT